MKTVSSGEHLNRGRVYLSPSAGNPTAVLDAYRAQFETDFAAFLGCRAAEVRPRGVLLLSFFARRTACPSMHDCYLWDALADALMDMAAVGLIDEEQVHAFNLPYYTPCPDDLRDMVSMEGSFTVTIMRLFGCSFLGVSHHPTKDEDDEDLPRWLAVETASYVRAALEPTLQMQFGRAAMDELFCRYPLLLEAYYRNNKATKNKEDITNVFVVLEKKQHG